MLFHSSKLPHDSVTKDASEDLIWHTQVPIKFFIFAWRLLRDRLPTKDTLVSRGILSLDINHCLFGCGEVESAQHLFLSYSTFGPLWAMVRSWIDFLSVDAHTPSDHFVQFTYSAGGLRVRRSFLQLI
jgi:hypothetical protein